MCKATEPVQWGTTSRQPHSLSSLQEWPSSLEAVCGMLRLQSPTNMSGGQRIPCHPPAGVEQCLTGTCTQLCFSISSMMVAFSENSFSTIPLDDDDVAWINWMGKFWDLWMEYWEESIWDTVTLWLLKFDNLGFDYNFNNYFTKLVQSRTQEFLKIIEESALHCLQVVSTHNQNLPKEQNFQRYLSFT